MSTLTQRLQVGLQQKQTLTPGLVQMVSLLQLNRLELKEMISAEIAQNPVLDEATEGVEELSPEELLPLLEAERVGDVADQSILDVSDSPAQIDAAEAAAEALSTAPPESIQDGPAETPETKSTDPFDEIDFGEYFDQYLDPGYKSPASEDIEKPSFETFLSSPVTLSEHLRTQLALVVLPRSVREAAEAIVGNQIGRAHV